MTASLKRSSAMPCLRSPSPLDVMVAYDVLCSFALGTFHLEGTLMPVLLALGLGETDGSIDPLGIFEMDGADATQPGEGQRLSDFARAAFGGGWDRSRAQTLGARPADIIGFAAEVSVSRDGRTAEDMLMLVLHTPTRSFRSYLQIHTGERREARYAPLQQDDASYSLLADAQASLSLINLPSSMPALMAVHPLHDIHSQSGSTLH